MSYFAKTLNSKATFALLMTKNRVGIPGEAPTIEVRRQSDGTYLDFSASAAPSTRVSSGGQKTKVLSESTWEPGLYEWTFDHNVYDQNNADEYTVIYRNVLPNRLVQVEVYSYEINNVSLVDIQDIATNVAHLRALQENDHDLEALAMNHYYHKIYDDNGRSGGTTIHEADIVLNGNTEERAQAVMPLPPVLSRHLLGHTFARVGYIWAQQDAIVSECIELTADVSKCPELSANVSTTTLSANVGVEPYAPPQPGDPCDS